MREEKTNKKDDLNPKVETSDCEVKEHCGDSQNHKHHSNDHHNDAGCG